MGVSRALRTINQTWAPTGRIMRNSCKNSGRRTFAIQTPADLLFWTRYSKHQGLARGASPCVSPCVCQCSFPLAEAVACTPIHHRLLNKHKPRPLGGAVIDGVMHGAALNLNATISIQIFQSNKWHNKWWKRVSIDLARSQSELSQNIANLTVAASFFLFFLFSIITFTHWPQGWKL